METAESTSKETADDQVVFENQQILPDTSVEAHDAPSTAQSKTTPLPETPDSQRSRPLDSSPPTSLEGKFRCGCCDRVIGEQDGVYLCKVCGVLDCSCDPDFYATHEHQGHVLSEMWLGEETLKKFKDMFFIT